MKVYLTNEQKEFILKNYSKRGINYCYEELKINKSTISSFARRNGLKVDKEVVIKNMSKNIINLDDYINVVDPKIAYILGLIWSDGSVSFSNNKSKTPIVKHSCVYYDSNINDLIFKELNWRRFESENEKSIGKNKMIINWISSRELGDYLISHNYRDKNKGTSIYEKFDNLKSHFIRGFFDGDGCITISNSGSNYKQTSIYFSSTKNQNWYFLEKILRELDIDYYIRLLKDDLGESSQLCIHDSKSIFKFCEYIYNYSENIRLERKYKKYLDFIKYKKEMNQYYKIKKRANLN
jgi:hypothetical protein